MSSVIDKAFSMIDKDRIISIAKELIETPSTMGDEYAVSVRIQELLETSGLEVNLLGSEDRPIVISTLNPKASPLIVFNAHFDTKPIGQPEAWKSDPFSPVVEGGKLYGRGASDCKSPCAVIIHLMEILKLMGVECAVGVQLVPDEEMGGKRGTGLVVDEIKKGLLRRPDYVVVGEKSNLKLRIAERGSFNFSIKFLGQASHVSRQVNTNAIVQAAKGVLALQKDLDKYHPWIGYPLRNVKRIEASSPAGIPGECIVDVYRALILGETPETVILEVKEALDEAGKADPHWRWEMQYEKDEDGYIKHRIPNFTPVENELVKAFYQAVPLALDSEVEFFDEFAGGTDARFYRYVGIPAVGFGAIGGNHHAPNEFVDVNSLEALAKVYLAVVFSLDRSV